MHCGYTSLINQKVNLKTNLYFDLFCILFCILREKVYMWVYMGRVPTGLRPTLGTSSLAGDP